MPNNKLTLSHQAKTDIADYIRMCNYEIGGFGYVTMNQEGDFQVDQVFLVKQSVTGTTVDFMDDGLAYAIEKAVADDRIDDLKFCWHSHVNMGAFWSGTDESMIAGMNNGLTPYIVSLVQNKNGEHKQRVDFFPRDESFAAFTPQVDYELDLYYNVLPNQDHTTAAYKELVEVTPPTRYANGTTYRKQPLHENRKEYLNEKVAKTGYNSLSNSEQDDYDDMLTELSATVLGEQGAGWNYYAWEEDDFGYDPATVGMDPGDTKSIHRLTDKELADLT